MTPELGVRARKTWLATGPSAEPAPRRTHAACVPSEARPAGRRARLDFTTCHSRESFAKDDGVAVLDLYHVRITTTTSIKNNEIKLLKLALSADTGLPN
jgi:hypothetical protein